MLDNTVAGWLKTGDGLKLYTEKNEVHNARATVLIMHGLAEHLGRYHYTVKNFNKSGLSVYRFDLRGHGRSEGRKGYLDHLDNYLSDTELAFKWINADCPTLPLFGLGHSMGSLIAAAYGIKYPGRFSGQIFSAAAAINLPIFQELRLIDLNHIPGKTMSNSLANLISHDQDFIKDYLQDPLVLNEITYKLLCEVFVRGTDWLIKNLSRYNCPCLILHGGDDQIVIPESAKHLFENITSVDKTLKLYDGLYHDILNESEKDMIIKDICQWIADRLPSKL